MYRISFMINNYMHVHRLFLFYQRLYTNFKNFILYNKRLMCNIIRQQYKKRCMYVNFMVKESYTYFERDGPRKYFRS